MPPARLLKTFEFCQPVTPSNLYCKLPEPVAVTVIVPSLTPQSVGSVLEVAVTVGAFGASSITGLLGSVTSQVPSWFLTNTVYEPAGRLLKLLEFCQFAPPLMEYSRLEPVAFTVIEPSVVPQLLGSLALTLFSTGCCFPVMVTSPAFV